jgi:hypothetical protein
VANPITFVLAAVVLVNTVVMLRYVRQMRTQFDISAALTHGAHGRLTVGATAPPFRAASLTGREITHERLAGTTVAFVFVSPNCSACRNALSTVVQLAPLAQAADNVLFVIVSDSGPKKTRAWLDVLREEDDLQVTQPILLAPRSQYDMISSYNPDGLTPYFCLVDGQRQVVTHGPFGRAEWETLVRSWTAPDGVPDRALT